MDFKKSLMIEFYIIVIEKYEFIQKLVRKYCFENNGCKNGMQVFSNQLSSLQ